MTAISKLKGSIGRALSNLRPLGAWLGRFTSSDSGGQPWARSPGAYALLAGVRHPDG
jgi:hypothetical protein